MNLKQSSGTSQLEHHFTIAPVANLSGNEELWNPSHSFYARLKKYDPLALRLAVSTTSGEERLLAEWMGKLKGTYPLFVPLGRATPMQFLFNTYRRCAKSSSHKESRCITVALSFPWNDPAAIGKSALHLDEISLRQTLAKFNFMALSFYVQQFCVLCRKVAAEARFAEADAYQFTAAVETFTREVYSVITEEALKTIDSFWSNALEPTQTIQALLNDSSWNELRNGLVNQLLSLGTVIDAIHRLNKKDKTLDSIAHTGYLLAKLMLEEINNSATRRKEDAPLEWDEKALLWQAVSMRLKFVPVILGTDRPGLADVLFGFFIASGCTKEQLGGHAQYHMILQWNDLKQHWQHIVEHKGIKETSIWIQHVKQHPQGDLSKGVLGLTEIQNTFFATLDELTHYYIGMQRSQASKETLPNSIAKLLPPFITDEHGNVRDTDIPAQIKAMIL